MRWTNQVQPSDHPCPALAELALAAGKEHVQELKPSAETTNCSELDDRHNWCNKAFRYTSDFSSGADLGLHARLHALHQLHPTVALVYPFLAVEVVPAAAAAAA